MSADVLTGCEFITDCLPRCIGNGILARSMDNSILETRLADLPPDSAVATLLSELQSVRQNRALSPKLTVRHALQEFFRNPLTGKFDRLTSAHLLIEQLLQMRVEQLPQDAKTLVEELANGHNLSIEHHLQEKLHV